MFEHIASNIESVDGGFYLIEGDSYCQNIYNLVVDRIELIKKAISKSYKYMVYFPDATIEMQLIAVEQHGATIRYIFNPSEDLQLLAIKQESYLLRFIKNPSENTQLEAVKNNAYSIAEILKKRIIPSEKVQLAAVRKNGCAIVCLYENGIIPSEEVIRTAITSRGRIIQVLDNPSEELQLLAVMQDINAINFIKNPTQRVKDYVNTVFENDSCLNNI